MRLQLNGWPPIASHLLCFFVGMAIVNLTRMTRPPSGGPRAGQMVIALAVPDARRLGLRGDEGEGFFVAGESSKGCRLHQQAVRIWSEERAVIVAVKWGKSVTSLVEALTRQKDVKFSQSAGQQRALCRQKGRVSYGA